MSCIAFTMPVCHRQKKLYLHLWILIISIKWAICYNNLSLYILIVFNLHVNDFFEFFSYVIR